MSWDGRGDGLIEMYKDIKTIILNKRRKKMEIELGQTVKDKVTGFQGVVTGKAEYLYGCTTIGVTPKVGKDGKTAEAEWFDEPSLNIVKGKKKLERTNNDTGGPRGAPKPTHRV